MVILLCSTSGYDGCVTSPEGCNVGLCDAIWIVALSSTCIDIRYRVHTVRDSTYKLNVLAGETGCIYCTVSVNCKNAQLV